MALHGQLPDDAPAFEERQDRLARQQVDRVAERQQAGAPASDEEGERTSAACREV